MGWSYGYPTRAGLIEILTADSAREMAVCIRRCTSGNVLWTVWATRSVKDPTPEQCFIECCLMQRFGSEWAYKSFGESEHPFQYSCPPAYLKLAAVRSKSWREHVALYWQRRNEVAKLTREIKAAKKARDDNKNRSASS